jgi:rare lipoprotein A
LKKLILLVGLIIGQRIKVFSQNLQGKATFYAQKFQGRRTATGEIFSHKNLTAASNHFKLGTVVKVTNLFNGKSVTVKVNDRMATKSSRKGRVVDLTLYAFTLLDLKNKSIINVSVRALQ